MPLATTLSGRRLAVAKSSEIMSPTGVSTLTVLRNAIKTSKMVSYTLSGNSELVFLLVDDEIVIKLIQQEIAHYEKKAQSWCVQGFPRTKVQALSL
jgi:adenylate kinase family enzyme